MANSHTYTFFRQLSTSSFSRPGFSSALPVQGNQRLSIRPVSTHAQPGMYSSLSGERAQHGLQWMQTYNTQQGHAQFPKQDVESSTCRAVFSAPYLACRTCRLCWLGRLLLAACLHWRKALTLRGVLEEQKHQHRHCQGCSTRGKHAIPTAAYRHSSCCPWNADTLNS